MTEQAMLIMELVLPFLSCANRKVTMTCVVLYTLVNSAPTSKCSLRKNQAGNTLGVCVECRNHTLRFRQVQKIERLVQGFVYNCMHLPKGERQEQEGNVCDWNAALILAKARKFPSQRQIIDMANRLNSILDAEGKSRELSKQAICPFRLTILFSSFLTRAVGATCEYSIKNKYEIRRCLKLAVAIHSYLFTA